MKTLKKVFSYMKHYLPLLILSLVLAAIMVILTLYFPILTGQAIDLIVEKGLVDFTGILEIVKKALIVIMLTAIAQWLMNICNNRMTYHIVRDIRKDAFDKIEKLPLSYIDSHSHGDLVSRVIADVDAFAEGLLMGFTQLFSGVATIIGTLLFMLSIDIKITLVVVLITPLSLILFRKIQVTLKKKLFNTSIANSATRSHPMMQVLAKSSLTFSSQKNVMTWAMWVVTVSIKN